MVAASDQKCNQKQKQNFHEMSDELSKFGIYFDEIFSLRVLNPKISNETNDLKDECNVYADKLEIFKKIAENFIKAGENFAQTVEKEKMRAIRTQNLLKTISKQRENEQRQHQSLILERTTEVERLKTEYQYLQRLESEQQEIINNFIQNL